MKLSRNITAIAALPVVAFCGVVNAAQGGAYLGTGLNYLDFDDDNSVNISVTTGYNFFQRQLPSANLQALTLAAEAQYSDSISGTDKVVNYSLFLAARMYTSERLFFKVKSGITNFPDVVTKNTDAEHSHLGLGVGLGYKFNATILELEYIYANKTLHASIVEISFKYHF